VAKTAGVHLSVRGLEQDRERRVVDGLGALEERRKRIVLGRKLLAAEEEQSDVVGARLGPRLVAHELDGDGDTAFHVAGADSVHRSVLDATGEIRLRGNRVVVACEYDQGHIRTALGYEQERLVTRVIRREFRGHQVEQVRADPLLVATLRRNVDELERPLGETVGEPGHPQRLTSELEMLGGIILA
jgi:hypothetical protein